MINLFLSNVISFFLLSYLGDTLLEVREEKKLFKFPYLLLIVIFLTLLNGETIDLYNTVNLTLGYLFFLMFKYKSKPQKKVIILCCFALFNALGEVLSASISNLIWGLNSTSDIASLQYTFAIVLSGLITFLFIKLYIKIINFSYWDELPKYTFLITILPITTMLLLVNIQDYFHLLRTQRMLVLILIGLLISNFIIVFAFLQIINTLNLRNELEKTKIEKQSTEYKYDLLNSQYKANYAFIHDTIREIMKIQSFLDKGEYTKFKNTLLELNKSMLRRLNIINSNSSIISPIINFRLKELLKNNIDFKSVIEYTDFTFLDIYEQRFIFDTLLEIGMLQCKSSNDTMKLIILKTKMIQRQVIIQLLTTHDEIEDKKKFDLLYNKLSEIVYRHNGKISFENMNNTDTDSLILIFNVSHKTLID